MPCGIDENGVQYHLVERVRVGVRRDQGQFDHDIGLSSQRKALAQGSSGEQRPEKKEPKQSVNPS